MNAFTDDKFIVRRAPVFSVEAREDKSVVVPEALIVEFRKLSD